MDRETVLEIGCEGGGTTVYGREEGGWWVFWREWSSFALDENDDEEWRTGASEPVTDLTAVLPAKWHYLYPIRVHPRFRDLVRKLYHMATSGETDDLAEHNRPRWREVFETPGDEGEG